MRGRGGGRGRAAKRPADDCELGGVGRGKVSRKASNVVANEPAIPAEVLLRDSGPFNASLLLEYVGKQNHATASLLADFFLALVEYGADSVTPGLLAMSQGMNKAVSSYATVCKDFDMANDRFEQSCNQQFAINQMNMELTAENTRLKVLQQLHTRDHLFRLISIPGAPVPRSGDAGASYGKHSTEGVCVTIHSRFAGTEASVAG